MSHTRFRYLVAALAGLSVGGVGTKSLAAQEPPATGAPQLPPGMSEGQALDRLRRSGLSRDEVRARLSRMGYDPAIVDPYFDRIEGKTNQPVGVSGDFVSALQALGLLGSPSPVRDSVSVPGVDTLVAVRDTVLPDSLDSRRGLEVFGRSIFGGRGTQFAPVLLGPVDAGYRLGPGDELTLILTGGVELAYSLSVNREGYVVIPDVGQLFVNGLTLEGLREQLYQRLGRVYSGVRRSGATTFFEVSLGRLRMNQVFVVGDAVRPGSYQVSAAATVFNVLHLAGGPSDLGSFRAIQVKRSGQVVATVDLYDYLIRGDASNDVRLEQGDFVFVPPAGPQVAIGGKIRRPAIFEVRDGEGLADALGFAGGPGADAYVQRVQIDRLLPPAERAPGVERVLLDVDLADLDKTTGRFVPVRDGDEVRIFATLAERRNRVVLTGSVFHPGLYEYRKGMTLWDLIRRADGLTENAFRPLAHVFRPIRETGSRKLFQVSLETDSNGRSLADLPLADRDSVVVYPADSLATGASVWIQGMVKSAGRFTFAEGVTVRDLVISAGGFQTGADLFQAEVMRLRQGLDRADTLASVRTVMLPRDLPVTWAPGITVSATDGAPAGDFPLMPGDRVFIRQLPGYVTGRTVAVQGEVLRPGPYPLTVRDERLSSVLARAGGPTNEAYASGATIVRASLRIGVDVKAATRRPGGREDIILQDGDSVVVPRLDPTVNVQGAVAFASKVLYREGQSLKDYIAQAGGGLRDADLKRVSVEYADGRRATAGRFLWFRTYPDIDPGSTIFVPRSAGGGGVNWSAVITTSVSVVSALATLLIAVNQISP